MPSSTATITAEQRDAIYALIRDHLSGIGDLAIAFELSDYEAVERLGRAFAQDLELLASLGWSEQDDRRNVALTMPPVRLDEALRRLRSEAAEGLVGSPEVQQAARHEENLSARYRLALETCDELIESLGVAEDE
jgi:hypothetical protein